MADERIMDQPKPISDQALDNAAGGNALINEAFAKTKVLVEVLSNIQTTRNEIAKQAAGNLRG